MSRKAAQSLFVFSYLVLKVSLCRADPSQILLKVPFFPDQTDQCGPSTLAGILNFWGRAVPPQELKEEVYENKLHGTLPMDMLLAAQAHGLSATMVRGDLSLLQSELAAGRPVLAMLNMGFIAVPIDHYVVVTGFDQKRSGLYMHSAGEENQFIPYKTFLKEWEKADDWAMLVQNP